MSVKSFWTRSRLKIWWSMRFRGYAIKRQRRVPRMSIFGETYYISLWLLCPSSEVLKNQIVREQHQVARCGLAPHYHLPTTRTIRSRFTRNFGLRSPLFMRAVNK